MNNRVPSEENAIRENGPTKDQEGQQARNLLLALGIGTT